ncbi:glycosyltransferase family 2 protein [Pelagicoccus enzymogenes]|uniref:glycosyltransferase n=1 Tax=Pelagicoccus enzymogenes TaxID=2773457 RepID=UPI00280EBD90|nr:glycosyltransferase family 2 protein [Pelagicoccus enzymogenes]MDQ8198913.1 glycosyltransferase family 2 protein [Pelagicoccus enzymogenes]
MKVESAPDIAVVIATYAPNELLERTLETLSACEIPETLRRVIIAENGPEEVGREIAKKFVDRLPVEHHFFPNAKKCGALNKSLDLLGDELIVYFDDDVRISRGTLKAYAKAAEGMSKGAFFGGQCRVDYDEPPEDWIVKFLPAAAVGWAPADGFIEMKESGALGFNWAAFASDLRAAGGYDERCGPGTAANSDEMNIQNEMLRKGVKGYYLPEALVWHYVPRERSSVAWLLDYKRKDGMGKGIAAADEGGLFCLKQKYGSWAKLQLCRLLLMVPSGILSRDLRFHSQIKVQRLEGKLEGIRLVEGGMKKRAVPPNVDKALAD